MSCDWGFRCLDCDVDSPTWFNHGEEELRRFVRNFFALKQLRENPDMPTYLDVRIMGCYDEPDPIDFLREHEGHALALHNEYGETEPVEVAV